MNKEDFYKELFEGSIELQELFEGYKGGSFSDLNDYVLERAQDEFYFPNDDPERENGRKQISDEQRARFNLFSRTLEEGSDYTPEALNLAKQFLASRSTFISQQ